ncbi:hypothetical protein JCM5353_005550 [Sporobolomyces roseus]
MLNRLLNHARLLPKLSPFSIPSNHLSTSSPPSPPKRTPPKPRLIKPLPSLLEQDLQESFVRGSGPGGQATNKTSNACQLLHLPSGLRVTCHETRSRETNRKLARRILRDKLDQLMSEPGESRRELEAERERRKKEAKRRKGKRKNAKSEEVKSSEEDSTEERLSGNGEDVGGREQAREL